MPRLDLGEYTLQQGMEKVRIVNLGVMTYEGSGEGRGEEWEKLREGGKGNLKESLSLGPGSGPCSFCFNSPPVLTNKDLKWY